MSLKFWRRKGPELNPAEQEREELKLDIQNAGRSAINMLGRLLSERGLADEYGFTRETIDRDSKFYNQKEGDESNEGCVHMSGKLGPLSVAYEYSPLYEDLLVKQDLAKLDENTHPGHRAVVCRVGLPDNNPYASRESGRTRKEMLQTSDAFLNFEFEAATGEVRALVFAGKLNWPLGVIGDRGTYEFKYRARIEQGQLMVIPDNKWAEQILGKDPNFPTLRDDVEDAKQRLAQLMTDALTKTKVIPETPAE